MANRTVLPNVIGQQKFNAAFLGNQPEISTTCMYV